MFNSQKLEAITTSTLIVGVDIAKKVQWARFTDYRGLELGKALKFWNDKNGFESILASIQTIWKRGRKNLRNVLYRMARTMVAVNTEMKELYQYLKTRPNNPLKKKQALVVISKKIVTVIYNLVKKQTKYKAELVLGEFRRNQLQQAA